jgi:murein DD-endopeptidase MepM/ murein hydrolase activator NlpD
MTTSNLSETTTDSLSKKILFFLKARVKKLGLNLFLIILISAIISIFSSLVYETPEEFALKIENEKYKNELDVIRKELNSIKVTLKDVQKKDDSIYRLLLGVEPLAEEIRSSGIGGTTPLADEISIKNTKVTKEFRNELNRLNARLKVQSVSFDELTSLASENIKKALHRPSIYPLSPDDIIRFSSGFGYRTHPIFQIRKFHKGIDLTALKGTPVYATAKGKVVFAGNSNDGYGNKVIIDHEFGYSTIYAHLHKINIKVGAKVNLGELLGQVGNTGTSVSPHLHYEVRENDEVLNPQQFIFKDISAEEYALIIKR